MKAVNPIELSRLLCMRAVYDKTCHSDMQTPNETIQTQNKVLPSSTHTDQCNTCIHQDSLDPFGCIIGLGDESVPEETHNHIGLSNCFSFASMCCISHYNTLRDSVGGRAFLCHKHCGGWTFSLGHVQSCARMWGCG